jgi:type VI secretion system secreted protein VgrG
MSRWTDSPPSSIAPPSIRGRFVRAVPAGPITIDSPLGADIAFQSAGLSEAMSQLFQYELEVVSYRSDLRAKDLLGQSVTLNLQRNGESDALRHWNGLIASFEYLTTGDDGFSRYRIGLRPWLWQLTKNADCRIFQHQSIPEIITSIFRDRAYAPFDSELSETYAPREYVVQYRETDLAFVMRLMDREGIYFFFRHEAGKHTLVLTDAQTLHEQAAGSGAIPFAGPDAHRDATREYVRQWHSQTTFETAKFSLADFDFKRPRAVLYSLAAATSGSAAEDQELYDYPGGFYARAEADAYAKLRLEQARAQAEGWSGETNVRSLTVGNTFQLVDHPLEDQNASYLVVASRTRLCAPEVRATGGPSNEDVYVAEFQAIDAKATFRTPLRTPGPIMRGPQTAIVVGPAGQEIWTDEYGRIKVQFHWDRQGKSDENASCWIRVAQTWACSGFGAQFIPRIGQEVIVDFLDGDPDRPIVTGSVYNGANAPPFGLPRNSTQSGIRTRSSAGGTASNANEIRFEDSRGGEELYLQAEKDMNTLVKNDQSLQVGANRTLQVVANQAATVGMNEALSVGMNRVVSVGLDQTIAVGANQLETVVGSRRTRVGAEQAESIGASASATIGKDWITQVGGATRLDLGGTLSVGAASDENHTTGGSLDVRVGEDASYVYAVNWKTVVGHPDRPGSQDMFVYGPWSVESSQDLLLRSDTSLTLQVGNTTVIVKPDGVTINGKTLALTGGSKISLVAPNGSLTLDDNVTSIGKQVTLSSSGAKLALASDAQLLGSQVKLGSGSGGSASTSSNDKNDDPTKKPVYIRVKVLRNGKPAAGVAYKLVLDGVTTRSGSTTGAGLVEQKVPATVAAVELTFLDTGEKRTFTVGKLEPLDTVLGAQQRLARLGFYHGTLDGTLGPLMAHALLAFQKVNGLSESGEIDAATQGALKEAYGS